MARATYIYLIRRCTVQDEDHKVLAAFTVKREAVHWAVLHDLGPHNADLSRMRDGIGDDKEETIIDWPVIE